MVQALNYTAKTFDICVDGKTYPVSASKLFIVQKMHQFCEEMEASNSKDVIGFVEKIYEYLKKILTEPVFDDIFAGKEYDVEFLSEFCCYLSQQAKPHMKDVFDRLVSIPKKYNTDNLNEPADPQTSTNG